MLASTRDAIGRWRSCWKSPKNSGGAWHQHVAEQGRWLGSIVRGYFAYHAAPPTCTPCRRPLAVRVRRRGQKDRTSWAKMDRLADRWLPKPRISHPGRLKTSASNTQGGAVCGNSARTVVRGGRAVMRVPTAIAAVARSEPDRSYQAPSRLPPNEGIRSRMTLTGDYRPRGT